MVGQQVRDPEGKMVAILKALDKSPKPIGSYTITRRLKQEGISINERTVRYHLKIADSRGYTQPLGRGGRLLTDQGRQEIKEALAERQIGSVVNKLKMLAYQTTFDPVKLNGLVPVNVSLIDKKDFRKALAVMKTAFKAGICVSDLVAVAPESERLGSVFVPFGQIGIATVCSVAVNGVLLKAGIPTEYRFSGILETKISRPRRFVAIVDYAGTSLDPSEEFIRSHMTAVNETIQTGEGRVLAVFRTIPLPAKSLAEKKIEALKRAGIGGVYALGGINEPLFQVPLDVNRVGIVQLNGLNPVAAAVESGIDIDSSAGSGMMDFRRLTPVWDLPAGISGDTDRPVRE